MRRRLLVALLALGAAVPSLGCGAASETPATVVLVAPTLAVASDDPPAVALPPTKPSPLPRGAECPTVRHEGRSFSFCQFGLTWGRAEVYCRGLGGHLATLRSDGDNAFVFRQANEYSHEKTWIGLNDLRRKHTFSWADGSAGAYTHWAPGEPNDAGGHEDCGQLNRYFPDDGWNDEDCDQPLLFVCESR
jgi:Lectin C-type domain